jgi:hypothetical protein
LSTLWVILAHKSCMHSQDPWINKSDTLAVKIALFN